MVSYTYCCEVCHVRVCYRRRSINAVGFNWLVCKECKNDEYNIRKRLEEKRNKQRARLNKDGIMDIR